MTENLEPTCVLDASAILAFLHDEPGGKIVEETLGSAVISTVNWSEVLQKVNARGIDTRTLQADLGGFGLAFAPFDSVDAERTAVLWTETHLLGLSLGDRACVAPGQRLKVKIVTADRQWRNLQLAAEIQVIR